MGVTGYVGKTFEKKDAQGRKTYWRIKLVDGRKKAVQITHDEWNHAECQSGCIRRGDPKCLW